MKNFLKTFQVTLKTIGPLFVGSGKEIGKKEYIFLGKNKVGVLDIAQVYWMMVKQGKEKSFEEYLLKNNRDDMNTWLYKENISLEKVKQHLLYTLDCSDAVIENKKQLQILEIIKDAYGNPYIPGSTLKGMFRTILLGNDVYKNVSTFSQSKEKLIFDVFAKTTFKPQRNSFLRNNIKEIETTSFHTINREKTKKSDAVNDILQGFIVSDSEPLSNDDLVLCQRVELHTDGRERNLPVLRECIKPGTDIKFTITIDTSVCLITENMLMDAIKTFISIYYHCFHKFFPDMDKLRVNQVLLGGGVGFVSKTIVYPIFNKQEGLKVTKAIFMKTGVPRNHKHELDSNYGVSPHILKCTRYNGKRLQMGLCSIHLQRM